MSVRGAAVQARPVVVESRLRAVLEAGLAGKKQQPLRAAADISLATWKDRFGNVQIIIPREHWELYCKHQFLHSLRDRASERGVYQIKAAVEAAYEPVREELFKVLEEPGFTRENLTHVISNSSWGFSLGTSQSMGNWYALNEDEMERLEEAFFAGEISLADATQAFVNYAMQNAPRI